MLKRGRYSLEWSCRGETSGSISIVAQTDGVRFLHWVTGSNGERSSVNELVPFGYTATRFGAGGNGSCASSVGAAVAQYLGVVTSDVGNAMGARAMSRPRAGCVPGQGALRPQVSS